MERVRDNADASRLALFLHQASFSTKNGAFNTISTVFQSLNTVLLPSPSAMASSGQVPSTGSNVMDSAANQTQHSAAVGTILVRIKKTKQPLVGFSGSEKKKIDYNFFRWCNTEMDLKRGGR